MSLTDRDERFYYDINNHDIDVLVAKIQTGGHIFSLEKMIERGLFPDKAEAVRVKLKQLETDILVKQKEEEERMRIIQNNDYRKQQIIDFCNQIADNQKNLEQIKIDILNGIVSLEEMARFLNESRLTTEILSKIEYFITGKRQIDFYLWKHLGSHVFWQISSAILISTVFL
jgi:Arc/MetJ-type ribon-helix-helix transcriptional regulator